MFADEEGWEDGTAVKERIAEREHRMIVEEAKASLSTCGAANSTGTVCREKPNRVPGDLLSRTIACRPSNEDRIRGIAA